MVSPIPSNNLLQSYVVNKTKPDTTMSALAQPVVNAAEQQSSESAKVSFSPAAQEKLKLSLNPYQHQMSEAKKNRARERAAEIKQRVDELKRLVSLLGALAPKALLRELKQLASELKSTANELKEGWGGSAGTALGGSLTGTEPETTVAPSEQFEESTTDNTSAENTGAEQQDTAQTTDAAAPGEDETAQSDASTATSLPQQTEKEQSQKQRREDQRLLQETAQELQSLFNRLKALLRKEDNDKETQKQLGEIEKLLTDTNTIANDLTSGIDLSMPDVNIAITV